MAKLSISKADILRTKLVKPGWHPIVVKKTSYEPAKSDGGASMNHVIDHEVTEGDFAGVPLRDWINEKAPGTGLPYLRACGFKVTDEGGDFAIENTVNKKLMVRIENQERGGRFVNACMDYRARP